MTTQLDGFYQSLKSSLKNNIDSKITSPKVKERSIDLLNVLINTEVSYVIEHTSGNKLINENSSFLKINEIPTNRTRGIISNSGSIRYFDDVRIANKYLDKIQNAKKRGLEFSISLEEFAIICRERRCFYTGYKYNSIKEISLDRIDSEIGYVSGNVVSCHVDINSHKGDLTFDEIKSLYERVKSGRKQVIKTKFDNKAIEKLFKSLIKVNSKKSMVEFNPCV